jgi:4,5-dihydroxyphthalate decarboxylase
MASPTKIRLASRCYDGVLPILRGQMRIPGFDFDIIETEDVAGMFGGMFKGQYDVSEMSLGELVYYTSRNQANFVAVPVFPSRMFRHGFIFCRKASRIRSPAELSGRKLGFLRWVQTAAIWMRGMLVEEYGVSAKETRWYVAAMHHWDDADPGASVQPRDGSAIRWIQGPGKNASERACHALFDGELDALGMTESQLPLLLPSDAVKRLFENPREVEASYFARQKSCRSCTSWRCKRSWPKSVPTYRKNYFAFTHSRSSGRSAGAIRFPASSRLGRSIISRRSVGFLRPIPGSTDWKRIGTSLTGFFPTATRKE